VCDAHCERHAGRKIAKTAERDLEVTTESVIGDGIRHAARRNRSNSRTRARARGLLCAWPDEGFAGADADRSASSGSQVGFGCAAELQMGPRAGRDD
jgi:hypothetical protein